MIRLEQITITNFCRFLGEHIIDLQPGITFIVSKNYDDPDTFESNAVGKTSILHAISYALFGSAPNGMTGNDLISHQCGPKDQLKVILDFSEGVTVSRYYWPHRKRSVVYFTPTSGEIIEGDVSYVNQKIQEFFKVTPALFTSALFLSRQDSTSTQFLSAKPADRSRILSDLVDDRVWQKAAEFLSVDAKEAETEFQASGTKLTVYQRNLQALEGNLAQITATLATASRVEEEKREALQARIKALREAVAKETAIELDRPTTDMASLEKLRTEVAKRLEHCNDKLRELPSISPPLGMGVTCPTCQSVVAAETVEKVTVQRARVAEARAQVKQEAKRFQNELEGLQERQQSLREWKTRVDLAADRRARFKTELAHLESEAAETKSTSLIALAQQEAHLRQQAKVQAQEIEELKAAAVGIGEKAQKLRRLALGFKSEMRNLLFDRIRGELENYTQNYLHNLAGQGLRVEYPSGEGVREKFDIMVYNDGHAQCLEAFSGGENWRAVLAILFALRDVLTLKSGCNLPLLLVDDPVGPVDGLGLTNFFSALQGLVDSKSASTILVTVPDETVATTGNIIRLERKGGLARVV